MLHSTCRREELGSLAREVRHFTCGSLGRVGSCVPTDYPHYAWILQCKHCFPRWTGHKECPDAQGPQGSVKWGGLGAPEIHTEQRTHGKSGKGGEMEEDRAELKDRPLSRWPQKVISAHH